MFTEIDKEVVSNTLAAAGASVADPLMSLVDTAFVGTLGVVQLAALGPNAALFNVVFFIAFMAMAVVTTDQIASANSRKDKVGIGRAVVTSLSVSLAVGLICAGVIEAFPDHILRVFQVNDEMLGASRTYCVIRSLSIPASLMMVTFQAAFRALLDLRTPFLVVLAAGILNLILDPLFMFTFGWGIAGAAWATTISQYAGVLIFIGIIYRNSSKFGLPQALEDAQKRRRASSRRPPSALSKVGTLLKSLDWGKYLGRCQILAVRAVLILTTYTLAAIVATNLGTKVIAAHQVINQLQQLQLNVTWAFLSVGQTMVANVYGSETGGAVPARKVANRVIFWGAMTSFVLAVFTFAMKDILPRIFIQDEGVFQIVQSAMLPACAMLAFSWNNALEGCLLGSDDQGYVVGTYPWAVSFGLAVLGMSYSLGFGLPGVWWGLTVYYAALVTWFGSRFIGFKWNKGNLCV
ncbi:unnamed protein product [Pedinophyceae sp. YPF-701]|nr:unnamed protein product [Pedinophyceae sp. YPF-701]